MAELELVVLDLVGTTVEDRGEVPDSLLGALAEHGIRIDRAQTNVVRGPAEREAALRFIPPGPDRLSRAEAIVASFRARLPGVSTPAGCAACRGRPRLSGPGRSGPWPAEEIATA